MGWLNWENGALTGGDKERAYSLPVGQHWPAYKNSKLVGRVE